MGEYWVLKNSVTGALHVPCEQSSSTPRLYSTKGRASAAISYWMKRDGNWAPVKVSLTEEKE